jgi:hypothetical protein
MERNSDTVIRRGGRGKKGREDFKDGEGKTGAATGMEAV